MSGTYTVYMHTFPSGKKYVGITKQIAQRWRPKAYAANTEMYEEIQNVGWDKVKHEVLFSELSRKDAQEKEKELIKKFDTVKNGYNKSKGGGGVKSTYFSKAVMEHLDIMRRQYVALNLSAANYAYQKFIEVSDDEETALTINLLEYYARQNKYLIGMKQDPESYIAYWVSLIGAGLSGEDVRTYNVKVFNSRS